MATATKAKPAHVTKSSAHTAVAPITKKLRPLGDRVVVQPTPGEETTKSGIVIPDTAKEKPQEGTILAVGPGRVLDDGKREQMDLKPGDKVLYAKYGGTEFKLDGEDLLIISHKTSSRWSRADLRPGVRLLLSGDCRRASRTR